jgi:diguanylate cyclase
MSSQAQTAMVADDFRLDNLSRLRFMAWVLVPINLLHVLVFGLTNTAQTPNSLLWHQGITWTHSAMALCMVILGFVAHRLLQSPRKPHAERAVLAIAMWSGLTFVGLLAVVDQWVTPNITPVLLGGLSLSLVFLIRPLLAWTLFGSMALLIAWALGLTQHDPNVLLSNRVNVIAAMCVCGGIATLLWRKSTANALLQKELQASHAIMERQQTELREMATHDALTGVLNRREFQRLAEQELRRASRHGSSTALVAIDLDHFKQINDRFGHPAGDAVLHQAAQRLRQPLRQSDILARYGGEEFMLLLPDTDLTGAMALAEKLRLWLTQHPVLWAEHELQITASFGVTVTRLSQRLETLYTEADEALYQAKQAGRNRVETTKTTR